MGRRPTLKRNYDDEGNLISKECSGCHEIKLASEFNKTKREIDRLRPRCKACLKKQRQDNAENIRKHHKKYYQENKEKINENNKKRYQENKEEIKEYNKNITKKTLIILKNIIKNIIKKILIILKNIDKNAIVKRHKKSYSRLKQK